MNTSVTLFISELFALYPDAFKNSDAWINKYKQALDEIGLVDFDKVWRIYNNEYESTRVPPPVSWVKKAAERSRINQNKKIEYKSVTAVNENGIYEFATDNEIDTQIFEKRFNLYWPGNYYDCPEEYKIKVEEIIQKNKKGIYK